MKAEEAKKLTEKNQLKLDDALKAIKSNTEAGFNYCNICNLHPSAEKELMKLGYNLTLHKDPIMGIYNHIITW